MEVVIPKTKNIIPSKDEDVVFPSDHFGVLAELAWKKS
jgi:hypothetical protein